MPGEDETFSRSLVLDLTFWWRHVHTFYFMQLKTAITDDYFRKQKSN